MRNPDGTLALDGGGNVRGRRETAPWISVAAVAKTQPLALDTPVRTPAGWTTMGDLRVGDYVYDSAGNPTRVERETEVYVNQECYRLTFSDGESIIASAEHGWTVERRNGHDDGFARATLSTEEIATTWNLKRWRYRLPLVPAHMPTRELALDPYLLGLWLGDGATRDATIAIDWRVRQEMAEIIGPLLGENEEAYWANAVKGTNVGVMRIRRRRYVCPRGHDYSDDFTIQKGSKDCRRCRRAGKAGRAAMPTAPTMREKLRDVGALGSKHIPTDYLLAGDEQRLHLLQGLMDSDGSVNKVGRACFTNKNERLIEGVCDLLSSLGLRWNIQPAEGGARRVLFTPPAGMQVARLQHKQERVRGRVGQYRHIVNVERVDSVPVKCIGIDTEDHLFQVGRTGILTHNTKNTMSMFGVLASPRLKKDYGVVVGKEQVVASGGGMIEAVTSAPATMEGNRPTFQVGNEPHHWRENNDGHAMRSVMDRNLKRKMSRILWITNAYNESDMSVGQSNREGWEMAQGENATHVDTGVMYDSLEAPESARLVEREITPVLLAVRGDSTWVDIVGIKSRMLDPRNSVAESRRFYYNQIGADEEAWLDPKDIEATVDEQVKTWRADPEIDLSTKDAQIRVGWAPVDKDEPVVLFFDGGKSGDHTAISGYRISDGYLFSVGHWGRPANLDDRTPWFAPRDDIDHRVIECVGWEGDGRQKPVEGRFNVVALWGDPSHAKDDENDTPYWDGLLDIWHRRWKDRFLLWAVKTGDGQHSVKWDMTSPQRTQLFVQAAEEFVQDMKDREIRHDGHPMFIRYMKNAKGLHTKFGTTLWKGARNSKRKIDGAVTHVGARMLGQLFLNREEHKEEKKKTGRVWGYR